MEGVELPVLPEESRQCLEAPITKGEIVTAIRNINNGKSPGEDGFPIEFYKTYMEHITPLLLEVYQEIQEKGRLPDSMNRAMITLIPKDGKDPLECGSYRPISLLNVDYKILAKILAMRLGKIIPILIHPDQTGFVTGRYSADNLRRLLHVAWEVRDGEELAAVLSLDAEKAFDRAEWDYLFQILCHIQLGEGFLKYVEIPYSRPMASVIVNGTTSETFALGRGTRQGCPLSPLLFILALEPLASKIRGNPQVQGVRVGEAEHKIALYADDILLFISNPQDPIPALLDLILQFVTISGYKINWSKSEVLPLIGRCNSTMFDRWGFRWKAQGLKYLGILINTGLENVVEDNISAFLLDSDWTCSGGAGYSYLCGVKSNY
ncbi:LINE-1 reverse transcriptase homolog isoform X1 [Latimeria chalumnae]|uniref:LINE-1 reverse transcriptase homolog isoform X1 n=1 Tax=Latimeria chalumnae TaxID=7897 RepID=UPI00313BD644